LIGIAVRGPSGRQQDLVDATVRITHGGLNYTLTTKPQGLKAGKYIVFGFWRNAAGLTHDLPARTMMIERSTYSGPMPIGIPGIWRLKLDDEFNGTALDASVWRPGWFGEGITGPASPFEQACYSSTNVTFPGDGAVQLEITDHPATCDGNTHAYAGAMISSNPSDGRRSGGFQYTYGVAEARIYVPASGSQIANWPAMWADGQVWPADGEDDIFEGLSGRACFHLRGVGRGHATCPPGDFTGWHTFASDWERGSVTYYYDGSEVGRVTTNVTASPMYLVLAYTVAEAVGGPIVSPSSMEVDYIRVWQHPSGAN
jgi:beta-glucanase (GH16 family)